MIDFYRAFVTSASGNSQAYFFCFFVGSAETGVSFTQRLFLLNLKKTAHAKYASK